MVDAADYDGMTPLHFASRRRGGEGCVAILLNAGYFLEHSLDPSYIHCCLMSLRLLLAIVV